MFPLQASNVVSGIPGVSVFMNCRSGKVFCKRLYWGLVTVSVQIIREIPSLSTYWGETSTTLVKLSVSMIVIVVLCVVSQPIKKRTSEKKGKWIWIKNTDVLKELHKLT